VLEEEPVARSPTTAPLNSSPPLRRPDQFVTTGGGGSFEEFRVHDALSLFRSPSRHSGRRCHTVQVMSIGTS
jgi:hypothetical protein